MATRLQGQRGLSSSNWKIKLNKYLGLSKRRRPQNGSSQTLIFTGQPFFGKNFFGTIWHDFLWHGDVSPCHCIVNPSEVISDPRVDLRIALEAALGAVAQDTDQGPAPVVAIPSHLKVQKEVELVDFSKQKKCVVCSTVGAARHLYHQWYAGHF